MSAPRETLEADLKAAMKQRDMERVSTLRMMLNAVKNEQIARGEPVDAGTFAGLVRKAIKQRRESADAFRRGGRPEVAAKEDREAEMLAVYLPAEVSEDDIRAAIEEFVQTEGLEGPAAMGAVMKAMMARFAGAADGTVVSRLAREALTRSG